MQSLFFILFASLTVLSAIAVVSLRNVIYCTFSLLFCLFNVACLYILLGAEFLAAVQILIYAGAVMILFIFTLMLIDVSKMNREEQYHRQLKWVIVGGVVLGIEMLIFVLPRSIFLAGSSGAVNGSHPIWDNNVIAIGDVLFTDYLLPFEVASIILLVAMVAAIILGKSKISVIAFRKDKELNGSQELQEGQS